MKNEEIEEEERKKRKRNKGFVYTVVTVPE
jgi:hypothetical protein